MARKSEIQVSDAEISEYDNVPFQLAAGKIVIVKRVLTTTTGEKIRHLRKQAKLTQTELGKKLGVKTNAVSKWECGRVVKIILLTF